MLDGICNNVLICLSLLGKQPKLQKQDANPDKTVTQATSVSELAAGRVTLSRN